MSKLSVPNDAAAQRSTFEVSCAAPGPALNCYATLEQ